MWAKELRVVLLCLLSSLVPSSAFLPATPMCARAAVGRLQIASTASFTSASSISTGRQPSTRLVMVDQDIIFGAGVALSGLVTGVALVAFTERQGERTAERGTISDTTRQKMSAMFMEDDELPGTDVGDVRSRLRAALKADQSKEEAAAEDVKVKAKAAEETDDGW